MRALTALAIATLSLPLLAQSPPRPRPFRGPSAAQGAEMAVKQAMEQFAAEKKAFDIAIDVLRHLRAADDALADAMQPANAVEKAYDEVMAARKAGPEFLVLQGVIRAGQELETARRSPMSTDFGRLRTILRTDAIGPATRLVTRNALKVEEDTLAWLRVQELIAQHVRMLSEISGESLRSSQ